MDLQYSVYYPKHVGVAPHTDGHCGFTGPLLVCFIVFQVCVNIIIIYSIIFCVVSLLLWLILGNVCYLDYNTVKTAFSAFKVIGLHHRLCVGQTATERGQLRECEHVQDGFTLYLFITVSVYSLMIVLDLAKIGEGFFIRCVFI